MRKFRQKIIAVLLTIVILFALSPLTYINIGFDMELHDKRPEHRDYRNLDYQSLKSTEISGKIQIVGNPGWAAFKAAGNCTGDGTISEPYVIEDLVIDGGGLGSCIHILDSDVYFRIENCTVYNSGTEVVDAGILLVGVRNSQLINNNCSDNYNGIRLSYSNNNNISGNTANDNSQGISLVDNSDNNNVSGNTVNNNSNNGIHLLYSSNNNISGNTASDNSQGISLIFFCDNNKVSGNTVNSNSYGIHLFHSTYTQISGNTANNNINNGIRLSSSNNNNISENTANNNVNNGIHLSYSNINSISGNTVTNNSYGILLEDSSNSNVISGNIANNNSQAIYLTNILDISNNNVISGNTLTNNSYGILLEDSRNIKISKNIATNNEYGIYLYESIYIHISGNSANNNSKNGIHLSYSNINNISGNTVTNNSYGILLEDSSNNNVILGNTVTNNSYGILLEDNSNNKVSENTITNNSYGILIETGSDYNIIYKNTFFGNTINALDNGIGNQWDYVSLGNYWGDYLGADLNDDGIGDIPYDVPPVGGSMDNYPIWCDGDDEGVPIIEIKSPTTDQVFGTNAPNFQIDIVSLYTNFTWYTIDGGVTNYTFSGLTGFVNQTAWDHQQDGVVTIMLFANDSLGNLGFTDVDVRKDTIAPKITINSPTPNQLLGVFAPSFSLTIDELQIQTKQYSLNGRPNITFTTETQFSQSEWDNIGNGTVSIVFYIIDEAGNTNSSELLVRKDIYIPEITIHTPFKDDLFGNTPPEFIISIIEDNLVVSTWYTIEGVAGDFFFTGLTGSINQDAWDNVTEGEIKITFFAIDQAGNFGVKSVTVIKNLSSQAVIPGYNLFFLVGILSIVIIVINKKLRNKDIGLKSNKLY